MSPPWGGGGGVTNIDWNQFTLCFQINTLGSSLEPERERERERETERQRQRDREREIDRERETDRERDRQRERQRERETETERDRERERERQRERERERVTVVERCRIVLTFLSEFLRFRPLFTDLVQREQKKPRIELNEVYLSGYLHITNIKDEYIMNSTNKFLQKRNNIFYTAHLELSPSPTVLFFSKNTCQKFCNRNRVARY